jgi:hypothetical protein
MKLSGFASGFKKFFSKERVLLLAVFIVLGMFLLWYSSGKLVVKDNMSSSSMNIGQLHGNKESQENTPDFSSYDTSDKLFAQSSSDDASSGYVGQPIANPGDLLPHDANSEFAKLNPITASDAMLPDMLQAGTHIGINTIGQSMRNANLQLRSDPHIPKSDVGPWNNSTIDPGASRQPNELN